jgi:type IV pilus assembly protein PilO
MATKRKTPSIDFKALSQRLASQFRSLDPRDPSLWPVVPRAALLLGVVILVAVGLWFAWLKGLQETLESEQATELSLKEDYRRKLVKAVNLDQLKQQREQIQQYVIQLEKQLPSRAEMAALLSDVNQAGLGRSLQFEVFRPGQVVVRQYYAELPIAVRVTGRYHDIGAFASDIAHLSRIVTLNNVAVAAPGGLAPNALRNSDVLTMDATIRTFRYLDAEEVAAQEKATGGAKK